MKKLLIASTVAVLAFAVVAGATGYNFASNLTVGSTGEAVSALQTFLIAQGYSIPAIASGAATKGYFGSQTKTAVQKYQTANGIPSTGFVGPLTRAALNGSAVATPSTVVCPAGYTCVANTAAGTTVTGTVGAITTPGVEGTLTVTQSNTGLASSLYEGDTMVGVLGFKAEAKVSDIAIQRVKIDLGDSSSVYTKAFSRIYVTDGSVVLASSDLNTSTVVKESDNRYSITLAGMNAVVPKGTSKIFTVKADVRSSVDSDYRSPTKSFVFRLYGTDAVRGIDGAGIDQYSGSNSVTRTVSISSSLVDSASLTLSLNTASPAKALVLATDGSDDNEKDNVPVLVFDLKAQKDTTKVTDVTVGFTGTAVDNDEVSTVYLYDGSTQIDSTSVSGGYATFSNIDQIVSKDQTKSFTVKVDLRSVSSAARTLTATIASTTSIVAENSLGDTVTSKSGAATGKTIYVAKIGPELTLVSKSVDKSKSTDQDGNSTTTLSATFRLNIAARGDSLEFGTVASATPSFASSTSFFDVYKNGTELDSLSGYSAQVSYSVPSEATLDGQTFTLSEDNTMTIDLVAKILVAGTQSTDDYAVQFSGLRWGDQTTHTLQTTSFMDDETTWRTTAVSLP